MFQFANYFSLLIWNARKPSILKSSLVFNVNVWIWKCPSDVTELMPLQNPHLSSSYDSLFSPAFITLWNSQTSDLLAHKEKWMLVGHMEHLDGLKMLRGCFSLKLWGCEVLIPDSPRSNIHCVWTTNCNFPQAWFGKTSFKICPKVPGVFSRGCLLISGTILSLNDRSDLPDTGFKQDSPCPSTSSCIFSKKKNGFATTSNIPCKNKKFIKVRQMGFIGAVI